MKVTCSSKEVVVIGVVEEVTCNSMKVVVTEMVEG